MLLLCRILTENPGLTGPLPTELGYLLSLFDMYVAASLLSFTVRQLIAVRELYDGYRFLLWSSNRLV